jgi:hypothetical protein
VTQGTETVAQATVMAEVAVITVAGITAAAMEAGTAAD